VYNHLLIWKEKRKRKKKTNQKKQNKTKQKNPKQKKTNHARRVNVIETTLDVFVYRKKLSAGGEGKIFF